MEVDPKVPPSAKSIFGYPAVDVIRGSFLRSSCLFPFSSLLLFPDLGLPPRRPGKLTLSLSQAAAVVA